MILCLNLPPKKKHRRDDENNFFPGDPRFTFALSVHADDVQALRNNQYLSANLLDYIIQRGAPSPTPPPSVASQNEDTAIPPLYVGGLATIFFIKKANSLLDPKMPSSRKSLEIIRKNLKSYKDTNLARGSKLVVQWFITPISLSL